MTTSRRTTPRSGLRRVGILVSLAAAMSVAACSGGGADDSAFVTQADFRPGGVAPPCLMHQTEEPSDAYQGGPNGQPVAGLTFLAYYTAAGNSAFCDGQPATDTDRSWAQLYTQLTNNPDKVKNLLN